MRHAHSGVGRHDNDYKHQYANHKQGLKGLNALSASVPTLSTNSVNIMVVKMGDNSKEDNSEPSYEKMDSNATNPMFHKKRKQRKNNGILCLLSASSSLTICALLLQ